MSRLVSLLTAAACLLAVAPAAASAHPGQRGFDRTYPYASRLCTRVANGHTPKALSGSTAAVAAACAQLKSSFTAAQNGYTTAVAPLKQQGTDAVKTLRATCAQDRAAGNAAACHTARASTRATLRSLRAQVRVAAIAYHASVDGARKSFWATIRSLRGGTTLKPDASVGPGPASPIPSDSAVDQT
jgi:hypothetical protein